MLNVMENRMDPIIDIDDLLNLSNADHRRFNNIMRELTYLLIVMHICVCYLIKFVVKCEPGGCANWFMDLTSG